MRFEIVNKVLYPSQVGSVRLEMSLDSGNLAMLRIQQKGRKTKELR